MQSKNDEFAADEKSPEALKEEIKHQSFSDINATKSKNDQDLDTDNTSTQEQNLLAASKPRTSFKDANYTVTMWLDQPFNEWSIPSSQFYCFTFQ